MAIDDLGALKQELPEVFDARTPPAGWGSDWIIFPIDEPESPTASAVELGQLNDIESVSGQRVGGALVDRWPGPVAVPTIEGTFPGSPGSGQGNSPYPPPDALAFYLPFHYYFPDWWGVYLTVEGVFALARFIWLHTGNVITPDQARVVSRLFLYGHEAYHHAVECFATRLEVTHRVPLYRHGFEALYQRTAGSDDAQEEALATAKGYALAGRVARRLFRGQRPKQRAVQDALADYILGCPPGYRRAVEVKKAFAREQQQFAEASHRSALPTHPTKDPALWATFPYAIAGIARRVSRVNYIVHRSSPLLQRLPANLRYYTYGDLVRKLKGLAGVRFVRHGKGSHEIWRTPGGHTVVIPRHSGDLRTGTLAKIIKQAGLAMSVEEFVRA
jgi:predicted RNA binding protein YcfA (HicA-like mRNA interferase family)